MSDTTNFFEFKADWEKLAEKTGASVGQVQKKVAVDLWAEITRRTPVDTGRARANWMMSVGAPSGDVDLMPQLKSRRKKGGARTAKGQIALPGQKGGYEGRPIPTPSLPDIPADGKQDIFITNNLPYIGALEDGHSQQQAPSGMVKLGIEAVKERAEKFLT